ncbi:MAG: 1-deoxy-D-xylulose-5-phosphate synthase [Candidatus Eiseniibacteriota bacterium]
MNLLERIQSPDDLQRLTPDELEALAREMREFLVENVAQTGGHLAPSLGVVELTIALHTVFDTPRDRIIWDVGHQAYGHKLLTGRRERFDSLRQLGGISGFPRRDESPYDAFGTAHGSTSISAALGMAAARDLVGDTYHVVAVIGDGALTGGLAYEGLNNAGDLKKNLLVILNDNDYSISPNVGGISRYLTRITSGPLYRQLEADVWDLLGQVPLVGKKARKAAARMKESLKTLVVPNLFFEELGFKYYGPVDGHDLRELVRLLAELKQIPGPVFLHIRTVKGKGYAPAEQDACKFHGLGRFDKLTGAAEKSTRATYTGVFSQALIEEAEQDTRVVAITAAMPDGTGLSAFQQRFPDRFFDVGMAEQHAVCFAAGMATAGAIPVAAIYSTFLQRAYDQIVHDVMLQKLPVVLAIDRAGLVGEDGSSHHGVFDIAYLRSLPGFVVMAPRDENELRSMLKTALAHRDGPSAVRYPRAPVEGVAPEAPHTLEIGKGQLLRKGEDVAIVALGTMVGPAVQAAERLEREGIRASVFDARFVQPLDREALADFANRIGRIVTVEEAALAGGFGSAVIECLADQGLHPPVLRIGVPDRLVTHGTRTQLLELIGLTPEGIAREVGAWLARTAPVLP